MRILYLCHRFPWPPEFGSKVRAFHTIRHLAADHEVTVASLVRSPAEAEAAQGLAPHCKTYLMESVTPLGALTRVLLGAPTPRPASMAYFDSPALRRRVRNEIAHGGVDLIIVHSSSMGPYVEDVDSVPKILDFVDMDSQKWLDYTRFQRFPRALVYQLEGVKLRRAEARLARRFDYCTCATGAELETLRDHGTDTPADWFPNGVDLEYFRPSSEPYDPDEIVFVGRMDYFPNQQGITHFCVHVLPRVRAERPNAKLTIVGANPSSAVRKLVKLPGVTVTGTVPDVRPYVHRAALAVAPLHIARGTQNKILEAMAMGVPVVASTIAARGIDAVPGEHFLAAESPDDFAGQVLRLMVDAVERRRFAEAGRARMESHHAWPAAMARLDRIIEACLNRPRAYDRVGREAALERAPARGGLS